MEISFVIPAHNEADTLGKVVEGLIEELRKEGVTYEIIVVDDNSSDTTSQIAEDLARKYSSIRVIHRESPPSFGRALREGIARAKGGVIIPFMGDASDNPQDAIKMFRKMKEGYDVVYGSRFIKGGGISYYPRHKLILNRIANNLMRVIFGIRENDITNAFKAYRKEVLEKIGPIEAKEFDITIELPLKAYIMGFSKIQVPVSWHGRESGVSKLNLFKMGKDYFFTLLKIWFTYAKRGFHKKTG